MSWFLPPSWYTIRLCQGPGLQPPLTHLDNIIHVQVAGSCQHILHRGIPPQDQLAGIHKVQKQPKGWSCDNLVVDTHQIPLVQFPLFVEKLEKWAAGGQHSPMGQELGATHHHRAVTKETLGPLLSEALQQLLAVFWELHSTPRRERDTRKVATSGSLGKEDRGLGQVTLP